MDFDAEMNGAASHLRDVYLRERIRVIDDFISPERGLSARWRKAAFFLDDLIYLTPEELDNLNQRIKIELRKCRRRDPQARPADARQVTLFMYALPETDAVQEEQRHAQ